MQISRNKLNILKSTFYTKYLYIKFLLHKIENNELIYKYLQSYNIGI